MATNWVIPDANGLQALLDAIVLQPASAVIGGNVPVSRADKCIALAVQRIRGAIARGNRTPLSLTAGSVPAESEAHCYALALGMMVGAIPTLMQFVILPERTGGKAPLAMLMDTAEQWLKDVKNGDPVEYPSDPQTTDASGYVVADSGSAGDIQGETDMTTDGASIAPYTPPLPVGATRYTGTVNPNGVQTANVNDQYLIYNSNGELQFVYIKSGQSGTNTNWIQAVV